MTKTIYISGPITDLSTGQPREGWQQDFLDAESKLRGMGFQVINPVDIAREVDETWHRFWSTQGYKSDTRTDEMLKQGPTRGMYIMACLQKMNEEAIADGLHGVYVLGKKDYCNCCGVPLAMRHSKLSDGVMMELHMAKVLDIPIFAEFYDDNEIAINLEPMIAGKRLLDNGDFGKENWSERL